MKYLIFLLPIVLFMACQDDEGPILVPDDDMMIEPEPEETDPLVCLENFEMDLIGLCDSTDLVPDNNYCEVIYIGAFELSDLSKSYAPQFCYDIDAEFVYTNASGDEMSFQVADKRYYTNFSKSNSLQKCEYDMDKTIAYCLDKQNIVVHLVSIAPAIDLEIKISTDIDRSTAEIGLVGDKLTIGRSLSPNTRGIDFSAVLDPKTLSYDVNLHQEMYSTIELLDQTFTDVISNDVTAATAERMKFYYNTDGLVGFYDLQDVLWVLKS